MQPFVVVTCSSRLTTFAVNYKFCVLQLDLCRPLIVMPVILCLYIYQYGLHSLIFTIIIRKNLKNYEDSNIITPLTKASLFNSPRSGDRNFH